MYSQETRDSTIRYYEIHKNEKAYVDGITSIWQIARSTFYKWLSLHKNNKLKIEKRRNKYKSKITHNIIKYLYTHIKRKTFIKINKVVSNVFRIFGVKISKSSIYRLLRNSNMTYKRIYQKKNPTIGGNKQKIKELMNKLKGKNIISIDETSIILDSYNSYGWGNKGEKIVKIIKKVTNNRYSLIMSISKEKVVSYKLVRGSINGEIFKEYMDEINIEGASMLVDNARIHHYRPFKEQMNKKRIEVIYNIAYNPESNPIENVFSLLKKEIKSKSNDNINKVDKIIKKFCREIKKETLENIYNKCHKFT